MSDFNRANLKNILGENATADVLDKIFSLYQNSLTLNYVSKSEHETDVQNKLNEYKSTNPIKKYDDFDEYRNLKQEYDSLLLNNKLSEAKVKAKYISLVKSKIDANDFDTSLNKAREEYPEFFEQENENANENNAKPSISTEVTNNVNTPDPTREIYNQFVKGLGK